eukprot:TRINITY_DN112899_c0_g1_i1.p2 TRINITY_DN112899_c0_g1~~TRINITY_DN112899_c0_g1_i1.p2  ORF type:complete len:187 (+),score=11.45 TRINITY_DN112899_c0_g1_i1:47-607(+)
MFHLRHSIPQPLAMPAPSIPSQTPMSPTSPSAMEWTLSSPVPVTNQGRPGSPVPLTPPSQSPFPGFMSPPMSPPHLPLNSQFRGTTSTPTSLATQYSSDAPSLSSLQSPTGAGRITPSFFGSPQVPRQTTYTNTPVTPLASKRNQYQFLSLAPLPGPNAAPPPAANAPAPLAQPTAMHVPQGQGTC